MLNTSQKLKSTPVGDIPVDWEIGRLRDFAIFKSGGTPARAHQEAYFNGNITWIKTTDLNNSSIYKSEETITELGLEKSSCSIIEKEAVIIAMYGGYKQIGRTGILTIEAAINQALTAVICDKKKLAPQYLLFWLNHFVYIWRRFAASSRKDPNITKSDITSFPVALPPLPEQRKIAKILGTWDRAIDTQQELINSLIRRKKALMQQLLTGKTRLPGFEGEWGEVTLSDLFSRVSTKNKVGHTQVVTISAQRGLICQQDYFNKQIASKVLDNYFVLKKGQFAYNKSYSKGYPMGAIKRLNRYDHGVVTTLYICFALKSEKDSHSDFWEHYFESGALNRGLTCIAHEGGRAHGLLNVTPKDFFELTLNKPTVEEQKAIAKVLTTAAREITLHTSHFTLNTSTHSANKNAA